MHEYSSCDDSLESVYGTICIESTREEETYASSHTFWGSSSSSSSSSSQSSLTGVAVRFGKGRELVYKQPSEPSNCEVNQTDIRMQGIPSHRTSLHQASAREVLQYKRALAQAEDSRTSKSASALEM